MNLFRSLKIKFHDMKVNCLIVDDEPSAVELIKNYLEIFKEFKVVGVAYNGADALRLIEQEKIDLVFLDINLPDIPGIYLMKSLIHPPEIIFVTGAQEHAITAYEYDVVDYILKPISLERFMKAISKFKSKRRNSNIEYKIPSENKNVSNFFKLKVNNKTYNLKLSEVLFFESMREFVKIHFINEDKLVVKYVLTKLENSLPNNFIRIHKSYIVPLDKVRSFTNKYIEIGEIKIPIGTVYKNQVLKILSKSNYEVFAN